MVDNLITLKVFFKEFTYEVQDLHKLEQLQNLEINCLSDSTKYFKLTERQFKLQFFDSKKINFVLKMTNFNLEMNNIFEKFNQKQIDLANF